MNTGPLTGPETMPRNGGDPDPGNSSGHKLPRERRYLNISTLWIPYYRLMIRAFYRLHIRHEVATALSILCGLAAAWLIAGLPATGAFATAALLVHLKDVFDATDGAVARLTGTGHRFGRFLDTVGDGVVFTAWIGACSWVMTVNGTPGWTAVAWATAGWLTLFLQCSYYNFYHLHYARLAGATSTSKLDEDYASDRGLGKPTRAIARIYQVWFGWQDRLIDRFDRLQRTTLGLPGDPAHSWNDVWFSSRPFMTAASALCFGTHAFLLVAVLLAGRPEWFLPAVVLGMTAYLAAIVTARQVVFGRSLAHEVSS